MANPKTTQGSKSSTMRIRTQDFIAHESSLTSRSEFFRRAMNGNWQEADTRVINFPDDEPDTFALYISYVYIGGLSVISKTAQELRMLDKVEFRVRFVTDLWTAVSITSIFDQFQLLHKDFTKDLGESIAKARAAHLGNIPKKKGIDTYYENIEQD
ncbi:uncharacterized protein J4E84_000734 [Alternaria hordeiaustralica]|uniref:uncharacterized protein n=1 Tax=Alternaria hordeiaustralica TaxID=1187925 RepID=UPI0020C3AC14|nr:uncharacterized protein J4E84_000734 [Alternaria hordeiaustralica]KAI4697602.1 hypothetical protein J4E84_000734 [Alternaria hordeiaustralica]